MTDKETISTLQKEANRAKSEERRVKALLFDMQNPTLSQLDCAEYKALILNLRHELSKAEGHAERLQIANMKLKNDIENIKRDYESGIYSMEYGYKQCEKGINLEQAKINYNDECRG